MCEPSEEPPAIVFSLLERFKKHFLVLKSYLSVRWCMKVTRLNRTFNACCARASTTMLRLYFDEYFPLFDECFGPAWRPDFSSAFTAALRFGRCENARILLGSELAFTLELSKSGGFRTYFPLDRNLKLQEMSSESKKKLLMESFAVAYRSRSYTCLRLICDQLDVIQDLSGGIMSESSSDEYLGRAYLCFLLVFSLLKGNCEKMIALVFSVRPETIIGVTMHEERRMALKNLQGRAKRKKASARSVDQSLMCEPLPALMQKLRVSIARLLANDSVQRLQCLLNTAFPSLDLII
jgi:hypothetical protein